ncbi:MAG: hypothetical protein LBQ81_09855 [Zoogloeaceae bacterium]|jgi:hypothetical protein|nr:hypothetical protein [Zoogloeaceae bacterium]
MTHTLYRAGSIESQASEVCWLLYTSKGLNDTNFVEAARHYIAAVEATGDDVNWGETQIGTKMRTGTEHVKNNLKKNSRLRGVFSQKQSAVRFLKEIQGKNLFQSVLISGILTDIAVICAEAGVVPRYCNFSLGIFGNKAKLPDEQTLAITTMCGHHRISPKYVQALRQDVERGWMSAEDAAHKLASICLCGIFNPKRACTLLQQAVSQPHQLKE